MLRCAPALGWSLLGYVAVILVWPVAPDRFLWAVWPFLGVVFALGTTRVWHRVARARPPVAVAGRWCVAVTVAVVVAGYGFYQVRGYARGDVTRLQDGISTMFG